MADLKRVRLPGGTLIWEPDEENEDDAFTFSDLIGRAVSEGGFDIVRHRSCGHLYIDPDWVDHPIEDCPVCREFQRSRLAVIDVPDRYQPIAYPIASLFARAVSTAHQQRRRLGSQATRPRWTWVADTFVVGKGVAIAICKHLGLDPDVELRGDDPAVWAEEAKKI